MENQALVFLKGNTPVTTSLKVAEYFGKRHRDVIRAIEDSIAQLEGVRKNAHTPPFTKTTYVNEQNGQRYPMYLLNRDGFTFVVMGFTGEKATQFKWNYIQAFNAMEKILLNRQNEEWQQIRLAGKRGNQKMCDAVHDVIVPLARAAGSKTPERMLYMNYQRLINKAAGINPKSRDELPITLLYEVEKMQSIADVSIRGLAARGEDDFHKIYRDTKQTLENYSRLSLITERFLPT